VPRSRRRTSLAFSLVLVASLGLVSCSLTVEETPPNIVLVVLDTVRDDVAAARVPGCPDHPVAPWLGRVAEEGTTFANAWANAPWTLPSHASLFTGEMPSTHNCTSASCRFAYAGPTMAERLSDAGYRTMAFFSNPWLTDRLTGVMRGFDEQYVDPRLFGNVFTVPDQGGRRTVGIIDTWLERNDDGRPFLMFVNFLEAHLPYAPNGRYRSAFLPGTDSDDVVASALADSVNAGLKDWEDVDWQHVRQMYAGDVNNSDSLLGSLVQVLKRRGLYDDTVLIVTSDHGELIGEHGLFEHQFGVYEELLAVPLVIRAPGRLEPGVRTDPVMLSDLYATVLDLAGLEPRTDAAKSRSLLDGPSEDDRPVVAEYAGPSEAVRMKLRAIAPGLDAPFLTTAYLTIRAGTQRLTIGTDGSRVLDDFSAAPLTGDALERRGRELVAMLQRFRPENGARAPERLDPDLESRLRALGYIN
jgi:arylsulfatase A-like enzyme